MIQTGSPSNWPISTTPGRSVSRTFLFGSSYGRGVQQRREVGELLLADQDAHVHLLGARVVDQVRRGAAVEARLQHATGSSGSAESLTFGLGEGLLVDGFSASLAYSVPKPPSKMTNSSGARLVHAERVLGGLLALLDLVVASPLPLLAQARQEAHRRDGDQAERR